jgi:uncharacterized protein YciI
MLFVIIGRDGPNAKELRPQLRPEHLKHLGAASAQGKVKLAGPLTDGAGSLIVVDVASEDEAQEMVGADPYVRGGVFETVEVHPFVQVFPED